MKRRFLGIFFLFFLLLGVTVSAYQSRPAAGPWSQLLPLISRVDSDTLKVQLEPFTSGVQDPTVITHAGDERIFITTKLGLIVIVDQQGNLSQAPFLDITDRVNAIEAEMGLLGLAFHPEYADNGRFFVYYSNLDGDSVISTFLVDPLDADQALIESEEVILTVEQPTIYHKAGALAFGPDDGYLYVALGEGGRSNNGQLRSTLLGKILRLDVDGSGPYTIPPDNPFVGDPETLDEIWALGLRNPWRISFDRETGDLFIADVGEKQREEINVQSGTGGGGRNYGWACYEGSALYAIGECSSEEDYIFPIHEYAHDTGGCSVIGGYVYRGARYPSMVGYYFFSDFCSSIFWTLSEDAQGNWHAAPVGERPGTWPTTFGEDVNGELYVGGYFVSDIIYHIKPVEAP